MNQSLIIDAPRFQCLSLTQDALRSFSSIIENDSAVRRFFDFGNAQSFFEKISEYDCYPAAIYSKVRKNTQSKRQMIGYINGYNYGSGEMLVEFFISEKFRRQKYATEIIRIFTRCMRFYGYFTFRFQVEEENAACIALMKYLGAVHCYTEDVASEHDPEVKRSYRMYMLTLEKWNRCVE